MTEFDEIDVFRSAIVDENIAVQIAAIKKLPVLAVVVGTERTREELLPCLLNYVDIMHEELLLNLSEQLEVFVPLVGGIGHADKVLDLLTKLSNVDETIVRCRAVEAIERICSDLDSKECEEYILPFVEILANDEWFTSKCSAITLIAAIYPKLAKEKQVELKNLYKNMAMEESPIIRRTLETNLVDFIQVLPVEDVKAEFIPLLEGFVRDDQSSIRILAADVIAATAQKLRRSGDMDERLLDLLKLSSTDESWRIRQRVAVNLHIIQKCSTSEKMTQEIVELYTKAARDTEAEVRRVVAENFYNHCLSLRESFGDNQVAFEQLFHAQMVPLLSEMLDDVTEVRLGLSSNMIVLSHLVNHETFVAHILPIVVNVLENEESISLKENLLKNLNALPTNVDIKKSLKSVNKVIQNLIENSQLHWRIRRNLLLALTNVIRHSNQEFFDLNLKMFYIHLLSDKIFAIRRTAPIILPLIIKQYGMQWAKESLIPVFKIFATDSRYLYRYIPLYGLNELIFPTLDANKEVEDKFLGDLHKLIFITPPKDRKKYLVPLFKINYLYTKIQKELANFECGSDNDISDDNITLYGEDTLESLKQQDKLSIFSLEKSQFVNNDICYLEGLLFVLNKDFTKILHTLIKDPTANIQCVTVLTLQNVEKFCTILGAEMEQQWVKESIAELKPPERAEVKAQLEEELAKHVPTIEDDQIDFDLVDTAIATPSTSKAQNETAETGPNEGDSANMEQ